MIQRLNLTEKKIDSAIKQIIFGNINYQKKKYNKSYFDYIYQTSIDGIRKVKKGKKYNFIDSEYRLLYDVEDTLSWFDAVDSFDTNGLCIVKRDEQYNFLSLEGELLSTVWFETVSNFIGNYAIVYGTIEVDEKGNITRASIIGRPDTSLTTKMTGNFLLHISGNLVKISNGLQRYRILHAKEFKHIEKDIWIYVDLQLSEHIATIEGTICNDISSEEYSYIEKFTEDMFLVKIDNRYNILKTDGTYLLTEWFDYIEEPSNDIIRLAKYSTEENNIGLKFSYCRTNGVTHDVYYDYALPFSNGLAVVYNDKGWNLLDIDFNLKSEVWIGIDGINVESVKVEVNDAYFSVDDMSNIYKLLK